MSSYNGDTLTTLIDMVDGAIERAAILGKEPAHPFNPEHWKSCTRPWCQDLYRGHIVRTDEVIRVLAIQPKTEPCEMSLSYGYDPTQENGTPCGADGQYCPKCELVHCREHGEC